MPKIVDHDGHRRELVETVAKLFAERGYSGLSMREIANAVRLSKSALYHYFPGKEALFEAVAEAAVQTDYETFATYEPAGDSRKARLEALVAYCADQEDWLISQCLILIDFLRDKSPEEVRNQKVLQRAAEEYVEFGAQFLGLEDRRAAVGVLAFFTGLLIMRLLDGQRTDYAETAAWFVELMSRQTVE